MRQSDEEGMEKVTIVAFRRRHCEAVARLVKTVFPDDKYALYLTSGELERRTFGNDQFEKDGGFVALAGGKLVGVAIGVTVDTETNRIGYLSLLAVVPKMRNRGTGSALLKRVETYFKKRCVSDIKTSYVGNPVSFLTGTDCSSPGYSFLANRGFGAYGEMSGGLYMIKRSRGRNLTGDVRQFIKQNREKGIEFGLCSELHRASLQRFMQNHSPPSWRDAVSNALCGCEPPYPVVVATKKTQVIGFAGPISVGAFGRGIFTGISVNDKFRRRKIGRSLFALLCHELEKSGASFIPLWTNFENPAQKIYLEAGFHVSYPFLFLTKHLQAA